MLRPDHTVTMGDTTGPGRGLEQASDRVSLMPESFLMCADEVIKAPR
jgi:hypothetical protein